MTKHVGYTFKSLIFYVCDLLFVSMFFSLFSFNASSIPTDDDCHEHGHKHGHDHGHKHHEGKTTADDMPAWKKKALESGADPMAAPFGGDWKGESSLSASDKMEE